MPLVVVGDDEAVVRSLKKAPRSIAILASWHSLLSPILSHAANKLSLVIVLPRN